MMRAVTDQDLLSIWELGLGQHPLDRALTVLAAVAPLLNPDGPAPSRQALAHLPLGERDRRLMVVHERIFGSQLAGQARCPACQSAAEFALDLAGLWTSPCARDPDGFLTLEDAGYRLVFHLPDSLDLAAAARTPDLAAARQALVERCIVSAASEGAAVDAAVLPERIVDLMAAEMARCDPQADVELALTCPSCGQQYTVLFDVESFLWTKIDAQARRLLREVDALARVYGWSEADILALPAVRRQAYLEIAS
jgi:hypothetical protein